MTDFGSSYKSESSFMSSQQQETSFMSSQKQESSFMSSQKQESSFMSSKQQENYSASKQESFSSSSTLNRALEVRLFLFWVWLWNQLLSAGLELVLGHTEKSCIVLFYRQFSTKDKMKNHNLIQVLLWSLANITRIILIIFQFTICGKLCVTWCNK